MSCIMVFQEPIDLMFVEMSGASESGMIDVLTSPLKSSRSAQLVLDKPSDSCNQWNRHTSNRKQSHGLNEPFG